MPCLLGGWSGTDLNAARLDKKVLERACAEAHKDFLPKFASLGPALQAEALDTAQDPNSQPPAKGGKSRSGKKAPAGRSPHIPTLPPPPPKRPRAENNTLNSLYTRRSWKGVGMLRSELLSLHPSRLHLTASRLPFRCRH